MKELGFAYIWEYHVEPSSEASFRDHYGPDGTWVQLFRRAEGYVGTRLYEDLRRPGRFVTMDRWESEEAFRAFRSRFSTEFERLDRLCECFTERETPLGEFRVVD